LIGIIGSIRMEKWTDKTTGQERSKPVVNVSRLELLSKRDAEGGRAAPAAPAGSAFGEEEAPF
jgi:single-strand DNA-binding protein